MKRIDEVFNLVNKIIEERTGSVFDGAELQPKPPMDVEGFQFSQAMLN